jgi:predicted DNA binding protein
MTKEKLPEMSLESPMTSDPSEPTVVCKFSIPLPRDSCVFEYISRKYPAVTIHYLSAMITGKDELTSDAEFIGEGVDEHLIDEMREHQGTIQVSPLTCQPGKASYRIVEPLCPSIGLLRELRLLPRYPFPILDGSCHVVIAGPESRVRQLHARLRRSIPGTELLSVRREEEAGSALLTAHQYEVLKRAVREGYYEVPRRASLKELAEMIGISKSSLWETLATIEKKLFTAIQDSSRTL